MNPNEAFEVEMNETPESFYPESDLDEDDYSHALVIQQYRLPSWWVIRRRAHNFFTGLGLSGSLAFLLLLMCSQASTGEQKNEFVRYAAIAALTGASSFAVASAFKPL